MQKPRILIVEDNPINVILTKKFLEKFAISETATTVQLGLQQISKNQYDMVLTDLNFGDEQQTGFDILKAVRQNKKLANIPILAITAYPGQLQDMESQTYKFAEIIQKPITKEDLLRAVQRYFPSIAQNKSYLKSQ